MIERGGCLKELLSWILLLNLAACTFLYIPPVREAQSIQAALDISGSAGLRMNSGRLELSIYLQQVPNEGWLAVQWYSPNNREVVSDSLWIRPRDAGLSRNYSLPATVQLQSGEWRAIVSFEGRLLRQFSFVLE